MSITGDVRKLYAAALYFRTRRQTIGGIVKEALSNAGVKVLAKAKELVSGEVLNVRSGLLYRSLRTVQQTIGEGTVEQAIGVNLSTVPYARIHEYGGVINHPGSDKLQAWLGPDDKLIVRHHTDPHEIPIPERPYLRRAAGSVWSQSPSVVDTIREAVAADLSTGLPA